MTRQKGFSLIELLIVVAVILVITAIAIPNFLRSKMGANEASAASTLKTLGTSNAVYFSLYNVGFAGSLAQLGPPSGACATSGPDCANLVDSAISGINPASATPIKSGYRFTYYAPSPNPTVNAPNTTWSAVATPLAPGNTGTSTFCVDNRNVILKDTSGAKTTASAAGCAPAGWAVGGTIAPL